MSGGGELDTLLHPPTRLQIAAMLARANQVEFGVMKEVLSVSDSVLSKHLSALGEAGYITIEKGPRDGRQRTWAALSTKGRKAFRSHLRALDALVAAAESGILAEGPEATG